MRTFKSRASIKGWSAGRCLRIIASKFCITALSQISSAIATYPFYLENLVWHAKTKLICAATNVLNNPLLFKLNRLAAFSANEDQTVMLIVRSAAGNEGVGFRNPVHQPLRLQEF